MLVAMRLAKRYALICVLSLFCFIPAQSLAATDNSYYQARVLSVGNGTLTIQMLGGPDRGQDESATTTTLYSYLDVAPPPYHAGDTVVAYRSAIAGSPVMYSVVDKYRLPSLWLWLLLATVLAVIFAGWRGLGALVGLGISAAIVVGFVIPQVLAGHNTLLVAIAGCVMIAASTIYLAHGFSRSTTLALASTYITLGISIALSTIAVHVAGLTGLGSEDIAYLHQQLPALDIQGALLAGILIGMLGVLDDVTVGQAATVKQLMLANSKLGWQQLYWRALKVGREHISSLINTLILAYLGSSFLFVLFIVATSNQPLWVIINSELVMEEVIRSLVGGTALILAVPISTILSAYFLTRRSVHMAHPKKAASASPGQA